MPVALPGPGAGEAGRLSVAAFGPLAGLGGSLSNVVRCITGFCEAATDFCLAPCVSPILLGAGSEESDWDC